MSAQTEKQPFENIVGKRENEFSPLPIMLFSFTKQISYLFVVGSCFQFGPMEKILLDTNISIPFPIFFTILNTKSIPSLEQNIGVFFLGGWGKGGGGLYRNLENEEIKNC